MATQSPPERRSTRSNRLSEAIYLQLVHAAELFDLEAFTLADDEGRLLATSTRSDNGTEIADLLAIFAPNLADHRAGSRRAALASTWLNDELDELGMSWHVEDISVREFYAGDNQLFLTAVGGDGAQKEMGIHRAIFGIRRIWQKAA
jgi:hypothetical protein